MTPPPAFASESAPSGPGEARWSLNRRHWEQTLDADNLGERPSARGLLEQARLFATLDVRWALAWLGPLKGRTVVDIGGGLAQAAVLMARRGARVVICDVSAPRLKAAKQAIEALGLQDRIHLVACTAEALPLAGEAVDRLFTKSVLIHTRLDESPAELGRVLKPGGRATFIEPTTGNPFVRLYRRTLGPRIWRDITTYFGPGEFRRVAAGFPGRPAAVRPFHITGFFATVFQFLLPHPRLHQAAEAVLARADRWLLRAFPSSRHWAWFGVLCIGPRVRSRGHQTPRAGGG